MCQCACACCVSYIDWTDSRGVGVCFFYYVVLFYTLYRNRSVTISLLGLWRDCVERKLTYNVCNG